MPSYTFAARLSACSRTPTSTSRMARMASGSPPSTTSCRPRLTNGSCSCSMSGSRPSRPCLRAMVLHSTIFLMSSSACSCGGLSTQEKRAMACLNTGSGVWMKIAAMVPTTTIMKAALDINAMRPAPLSTAPTSTATTARMKPMAERISMDDPGRPLAGPCRHAREQRVDVILAIHHDTAPGARHMRAHPVAEVDRLQVRAQFQHRHAARVLAIGERHQLSEHGLQLDDQLDDRVDDLPREIL